MSYILDALKKSEKKRMQGTVPDVLTAQEVVYHEPKRRRLWAYLIIAALLVNALAVVWFVPWKSKRSDAVVESGAMTKFAPKENGTIPVNVENPEGSGAAPVRQSDASSPKPAAEMKPVPDRDVKRPRQFAAAKNNGAKEDGRGPETCD